MKKEHAIFDLPHILTTGPKTITKRDGLSHISTHVGLPYTSRGFPLAWLLYSVYEVVCVRNLAGWPIQVMPRGQIIFNTSMG